MKKISQSELDEIIKLHQKWLNNEPDGKCADLSYVNLSGVDLSYMNLAYANLAGANLFYANLSGTNLSYANLSGAILLYANLHCTNLFGANLFDTNLSGAKGLLSPIDFLNTKFEKTDKGYIAYKTFNEFLKIPSYWKIKPNSIISEVVNSDRTNDCGCGINVGTWKWVQLNTDNNTEIWKVLIEWEWLAGVVVPYNTDEKIRCEKVRLLETIN